MGRTREPPDLEIGVGKGLTASTVQQRYRSILMLRLGAMLLLGILLAGCTTLTFYFTRSTCSSTLSKLTTSFQGELLSHTSDKLSQLLTGGEMCGNILANALDLLINPVANLTVDVLTVPTLRYAFTTCGAVSGLGLSLETGQYTILNAIEDMSNPYTNTSLLMTFANQPVAEGQASPRFSTYVDQTTAAIVAPVTSQKAVDIRSTIFYKGAATTPDGIGTQILVGATGQPLLVVAKRWNRPGTNEMLGVVHWSFYLNAIGRYMSGLELKGGLMFVTNGSTLVADSVNDYRNQSSIPTLLQASHSSSTIVREVSAYLQTLPDASIPGSADVRLQGEHYIIGHKDVPYHQLTFRQVMVLPRESIQGTIDAGKRYTTYIVSGVTAAICVLGFVLIVCLTDPVSKEMRLKAQLISNLEAKRQAEMRAEFKSKFFAKTSHDLRTPLTAMLGLLDIILESNLEVEQSNRLMQVKDCTLALLGLLNDILDFSKIEAGQLRLENVNFDIGALLESLVEIFNVQCTSKGLELGLDMPEEFTRLVRGDPTRCRQIFTNMLSNSIKFTKEGYILCRCFSENVTVPSILEDSTSDTPTADLVPVQARSEKRTIRLIFELEDTGCGIPKEKRDLVFQDYAQAELSTTREHGGTGLGLGIVRTLVEMMGGKIEIVDKQGPGTLFRFSLYFEPCARASHGAALVAAGDAPAGPFLPPAFGPPRLSLGTGAFPAVHFNVVFGSAQFLTRSLAAASMRHHGATVLEALSWGEALEGLHNLVEHSRQAGAESALLGGEESVSKRWIYGEEHATGGSSRAEESPRRTSGQNQGAAQISLFRTATMRALLSPRPEVFEALTRSESSSKTRASAGDFEDESPYRLHPQPHVTDVNCAILAFSLLPKNVTEEELEAHLAQVHTALGEPVGSRGNGRRVAVAWVVRPSTPAWVWTAIRRAGFPHIVSKPLYESKIQRLMKTLAGTQDGAKVGGSERRERDAFHSGMGGRLSEPSSRGAPSDSPGDNSRVNLVRENSKAGETTGSLARAEQPSETLPLRGRVVLVAEDNPLLQKLSVQAMQKLGADVETVENGLDAIEAIRQQVVTTGTNFDLVLMDCQMPIMDGLTATRQLRAWERGTASHLVIIALTAGVSSEDQQACISAGMDLYLSKPIDLREFVSKAIPLMSGSVGSDSLHE